MNRLTTLATRGTPGLLPLALLQFLQDKFVRVRVYPRFTTRHLTKAEVTKTYEAEVEFGSK